MAAVARVDTYSKSLAGHHLMIPDYNPIHLLIVTLHVEGMQQKNVEASHLSLSTTSSTNITISVPNLSSGIYSLALELKNQDGYRACSRKLLVADQDQTVLTIDQSKFLVYSGIPASDYQWVKVGATGSTTLEVYFVDAIKVNEALVNLWTSARVTSYWCSGRGIAGSLDDQSVKDKLSKLLSQQGVNLLEYIDEVTSDEGRSFLSRALNNSLAFKQYYEPYYMNYRTVMIRERQTFMAALRILDTYGRTTIITTRGHAVTSWPNVSEPWEEVTSSSSSSNQNDTSVECQKMIKVFAADTVAGIKRVQWSVKVDTDINDITVLQGTSYLDSNNNVSGMTASYCSGAPSYCYCPTTSSGAVRTLGCFRYVYDIPLIVPNCVALGRTGSVLLEINIASYSELVQTKVMTLWGKQSIKGDSDSSYSELGMITGALVGGTATLALVSSALVFIVRRIKSAALPSARGKPLPVYSQSYITDDPFNELSLTTGVHILK